MKTQLLKITVPNDVESIADLIASAVRAGSLFIPALDYRTTVEVADATDDTIRDLVALHTDPEAREVATELANRVWHQAKDVGRRERLDDLLGYIQEIR